MSELASVFVVVGLFLALTVGVALGKWSAYKDLELRQKYRR